MNMWQPVPDERSYGIAIYNFAADSDFKLELTVGDSLHLLEQEEHWYYGYALRDRHKKGIFPKSFVHPKACMVDKDGPTATFNLQEPSIAQEITSVLREWGVHWKQLYVKHSGDFDQVKSRIYDLLTYRSKIVSGTLPVDELKRVTKQATEEIDLGNKTLNLDLIVRDRSGNLIDPQTTSTLELYNLHKTATERMNRSDQKVTKPSQPKTAVQQYSNIFIVAVKNFTCKMTEDAELLMSLYDGKDHKPITESYVVRWSKDGLMCDLDQMYNLKVMFTDLGKRDLERERILLVCYVVRVGGMEAKELDHRRSSVAVLNKKGNTEGIRRPFGVAAMEITPFMNGERESDLDQECAVPFVNCDKDNLEQILKKIMNKDFAKTEHKNQALFVGMKLLHGDLKQVREENPHLVLGNVSIARKMGFPEVILPGDVRNDLYLTLVKGEFGKGNKTSDKNVEVVVRVCNEKGEAIPGVMALGAGTPAINVYKSMVYYHEDKPHWYETFKVAIPIEEFKTSHLKFTFKHRSSNEAKDKNEKPFAMAYVKLMQDDGTTLKDARHDLVVYKIDYKKFDEKSLDYLKKPSLCVEKETSKLSTGGLATSKDVFVISSNICSTKLTQNVDLLGLLNWQTHPENLKSCLSALLNVDGEEVVKFLQDILDCLFHIIMNYSDASTDILVFECLLHIISLVSNDWKYQHFEPVLDLYITESFSATLAHRKLISVLKNVICNSNSQLIFKTMKSLQYVMRFVSKSRILMEKLDQKDPEDDFDYNFKDLLQEITSMMSSPSDHILREQGACLKYLPSTIPDILEVFEGTQLSKILMDIIENIPTGRLTKQKMMTINEIVHTKLFSDPACRRIILPVILKQVKALFLANDEVEVCIKILSDILILLFHYGAGSTFDDVREIIVTTLRTVIQTHINADRDGPFSGNLVAIMIDIFRQMTDKHYESYVNHFRTRFDILDFLMEILLVFKGLVSESVFPSDWCDMIMLQNSVILKALRFFSHTIRDCFFQKFEHQAWSNFFHCAIAFMTQPALQLETFSCNKRTKIIKAYRDMRRETGCEVRAMWFNLGHCKVQFVPGLVENILEMTLIPESELRRLTIPIFFDMMQCEYYSSKFETESYGDTKRDSSHVKGNFNLFENEMIAKLDILVEGGQGDEAYKNMFHEIMTDYCHKHTTLRDSGERFVHIVTGLMERLLEYRCIVTDENKENRMSCTVSLLDFYSEIQRQEMYIRYVNKLYDLHMECDNYVEAAYTLELHAKLLNWTDDELPQLLKSNRFQSASTHRQLKEALYYAIIENYDRGKLWECAIDKCQELTLQHQTQTYDYDQLSKLYSRMSAFYSDIMKKERAIPEYFRVGYFGKGFPPLLQNKVFIYRGKEYERLSDFNSRILNEFPKAELLNKLTPPGEDIKESEKQYIQINKVDPVFDEKKHRLSGKPVSEQILNYYKVNDIQKFTFSRPIVRKDPSIPDKNEFGHLWLERSELTTTYSLPGILRWFPVTAKVEITEISPLRNAIETMVKMNKTLKNYVVMFNADKSVQVNLLSLTLNGILDAAVMGGIKNYEEAFFTEQYETSHADDDVLLQRLKHLIADQIPLLEMCVKIHKEKAPENLQPLQKRFEDCFAKMQESVTEKYGAGSCDIKLDGQVTMRRHHSIANDPRLSNMSISSDSGGRSRVSSLTKSQVASLKQFTSSFNFAASPNVHSKSTVSSGSKSLLLSPSRSLTPSFNHKKSFKIPKEKRRSSKPDQTPSPSIIGATQWYAQDMLNGTIELSQELTPERPLRTEAERQKRLSRSSRSSGTSITLRGTGSSESSSNRDSVGTTDSSISEEDGNPPPIPLKQRELDFAQSLTNGENVSFLYSNRNSMRTSLVNHVADEVGAEEVPPVPPPKTKHVS